MTILDTIVEQKRREVRQLPRRTVAIHLIRAALDRGGGPRPFLDALRSGPAGSVTLIAEIKKASPSAGIIRPNFDPVALARAYEAGGATCLSVLTDEQFFQGSLEHLRAIRQAVNLPLLRKDFIIDERQIIEAAEAGADAILLIVAILDPDRLQRFHDLATGAGLAALVEVHDAAELDRALEIGATLIGVNNRDLKTFRVDLGTTEALAARLQAAGKLTGQDPVLLVAESGIHTRADVQRLQQSGARAILVGESLVRSGDNPPAKIRTLLGL
jgi:indole-3-glycerol phosphate synthase